MVSTLKYPEYQKTMAADPHFAHYREFLETAEKNLKKLADAGVKYGFGPIPDLPDASPATSSTGKWN